MKFTDPDGEFIFTALAIITGQWWALPITIGADIGMWSGGTIANGTANPFQWDYSSGKTWGYMAGGALVGGLSGGAANAVATSGIPFANTAAIMTGSTINSVGMNIVTGGQTDITIGFGVASYNISQNEWGYLGKKGNSFMDNLGYGLGALANLRDVNLIINSTKSTIYTQTNYENGNKDIISHTGILNDKTGETLMSFGPKSEAHIKGNIGFALEPKLSTTDYPVPTHLSKSVSLELNKYSFAVTRGLSKALPYQGGTINCVNMSSLSLLLNGVPNIGIHPFLLHSTVSLYNSGAFRPDLYSYFLLNQ